MQSGWASTGYEADASSEVVTVADWRDASQLGHGKSTMNWHFFNILPLWMWWKLVQEVTLGVYLEFRNIRPLEVMIMELELAQISQILWNSIFEILYLLTYGTCRVGKKCFRMLVTHLQKWLSQFLS